METNSSETEVLSSTKRALLAVKEMKAKLENLERAKNEPIAIIGMGCQFPGANNPEEFWKLLCDGRDAIREVPKERWNIDAYYDPDPNAPGKMSTRFGGFLEKVDEFDPVFFNISPREAVSLDPQQRLLLEVSWEAIENSGLMPQKLTTKTGVFVGISDSDYFQLMLRQDLTEIDGYLSLGNAHSTASGRLSYLLGLTGPCLSVDTACSSSLVAVHLACQSLRCSECDLALAGGVNLILAPELSINFSKARMLSPDGRCKTFDAAANGYVRSEGCGVIVLKRLSDAQADGDNILAVIRGSAINQDGRTSGLTVPHGPSQQAVIRQALENGGVKPELVSYVEAHGTGTSLGDPIELGALGSVFGHQESPIAIGSVKTNIGHLESAAGIASLIKVVLSLKHAEIPPSLHFHKPNPHINWDELPVRVVTERTPWLSESRVAGVSSFGFSGTNAHVVLEEAPQIDKQKTDVERPLHLLCLSAKTKDALLQLASRYEQHLAAEPTLELGDICFTANTGRAHFNYRLSVVASQLESAREKLAAFSAGQETIGVFQGSVNTTNKIAFLFTGQGSQYVGMARQLYQQAPTFRKSLDRCDEILRPYLETPLLEVLYPEERDNFPYIIDETAYTQPALFAVEYSLFELWKSWGIEPAAVIGHSLGEYVAACVAGVFSLEDGLKLVQERGRLMQALPQKGEMVAVMASESLVRSLIQPYAQEVSIAAINAPESIVISGRRQSIQAAIASLEAEGIKTHPLKVSQAFHSSMMEPILDAFEQTALQIQFQAPRIPLISNLTGQMLQPGEVPDANYWRRHTREPVRFMAGVNTLFELGYKLFLELGPKPTLSKLGLQSKHLRTATWLSSLTPQQEDWQVLLNSLSALYLQGVNIHWSGFDQDYSRRKLPLPTYPFQRKSYWIQQVNLSMNGKNSAMNGNKNENKLEADMDASLTTSRREEILATLQALVGNLLQISPADINIRAPFLEMGADSIIMVEAVRRIENTYGIKIAIRQLFEELSTLDALAIYVEERVPPVFPPKTLPAAIEAQEPIQPIVSQTLASHQISTQQEKQVEAIPATVLERIISQQLHHQFQLMSIQLEVLQNQGIAQKPEVVVENGKSALTPHAQQPVLPEPQKLTQTLRDQTADQENPTSQESNTTSQMKETGGKRVSLPWGPKTPPTGGLTPHQQRHLHALIDRYTQRTQTSKKLVQTYRPVLVDSRASVGFRLSIKEMLYPIVAQRSQGSRVWDVDDNEYIDMTMGQGVNLFGHQPPFIIESLEAQIKQGIHLNPRSPLVGEVAELISELTGMEGVCFCNSGTEAVMAAIRVARATTGRTKIAIFEGSYHGHADTTLVGQQIIDNERRSFPLAPGVPQGVAEDVVVLDYGSAQSLEFLKVHAQELAAVLVEPVQSSRPMLQPREFLHSLRQITEQAGTALIFDEMITGFRTHPGGAQAWFGVRADIVTYGKVVAGGMPIGIVAGKRLYLDSIDGGMWSYGDSSYPQAERTFFGGTFCQHPLAMVAARSVLKHLKEQGPTLQQRLNDRTTELALTLNTYFREHEVPIQIEYFSSFFRFALTGNLDLLFYHMLEKGIYVWEWRKHFLSTAHTEADISQFIQVVKDSVEDIREGGFLPAKKLWMPSQPNGRGHNITRTPVDLADKTQPQGFWEQHQSRSSNLEIKASSNHQKPVQFSLYYFGSYDAEFSTNKYNLLFEGAQFGDRHGFTAIWIPERHFHSCGGFSPNPSVIAAALARETKRIQLRSGSVVLPLHHPIRVAEEWAVVDNLSEGRVGISFASGWHPNDFALAPQSFGKHRELMFQEIKTVQKLWQGESIEVVDGAGEKIRVKTFPLPMQSKLPFWITVVNNPDTYIRAGEIGAGILTNLIGQTVEDLARNITLYRESLAQHGYDPESGTVTVLLHTFVGNDLERTREKARQPFYNYLKSSIGLLQNMVKSQGLQIDFDQLTEEDQDFILSSAYKRYLQTSALIGTAASCRQVIDDLRAVGVDEIACFIDFGVDESAVLENLPHLNALKECYQKQEENNVSSPNSVVTEDAIVLPLTEAQKQLWMLAQLREDGSIAYNVSVTLQLQGPLNVTAMGKAVQKLVDRHEALRTKISIKGDVQEILPVVTIDTPVLDYCVKIEDHAERSGFQQAQVAEWFDQESRKPFDLTQGSLFRVHILKLEQELYLLVLSAHHIVVDGWSIEVILRDLGTLYSAECQGIICQMNPPKQFREYIQWQNQLCQMQGMIAHESYWLEKLTFSPPVLDLPTDRIRPPLKTYNGSRETIKLDAQVSNTLKLFSRQQGCTLLMTLLSVYMTLIHRLTGQDDIIVGVPTSGRWLFESEEMVGYCTHILPIRSELTGNPTFVEYLKQIRNILLEAYEHQDYPFAQLLNKLNLPRDTSRSPLVTVTFNLEPSITLPQMSQLETCLSPQPINFTDQDLHLNVTEIAGELLLECDYNTNLFDAGTIGRWLSHFQTLLQAIVVAPEQHLRQLPLLTAAQRHQLLVEWNDTETDYHCDQGIHQWFEAQVERTPDITAVVFDDQHLTYGELNARANQLAHYLQTLRVRPEMLVGICVERSPEMIVGLLGILKAGGAYVPLDPIYPSERLAYMLEDSSVPVLLTQAHLVEKFSQHSTHTVCLDSDWEKIAQQSSENPTSTVTPDKKAYVIYTSGSTGKPKGVTVPHRAVNRLVLNTNYINLQSQDVVAFASNFSFDATTFEIWGALLHGAKLIGVSLDVLLSPNDFAQFIQKQEISVLFLTTALFNQMASVVPSAFRSVRHLLFGGEAVEPRWVKEVLKNGPPSRLLHVYGPTENTTFTTWYLVQDVPEGAKAIPIGCPISNSRCFLLDTHKQPVPVGVPGELYIGGDGLAQGYLNRPDLTAEKFIPNPLNNQPGDLLYKTGDLARYLTDGNIEFLGRIDNQVKIRGFRIELGEIEAVLTTHPEVREAVVIDSEDILGNKRLVAYVVALERSSILNQLRDFLKQKLPSYMVPSAFVILDALPLTPNCKVDRRALPDPDKSSFLDKSFVPPHNEIEKQLAQIWSDILKVQPVGIKNNFFDLGGHSLVAIRLMVKIEQEFGKSLPISTLFQFPTIEDLANHLETDKDAPALSTLVPVQPQGNKLPFFCVHPGGGDVLCYADLAHYLGDTQPFWALRSLGLEGECEPLTRIEDMAATYIKALQTIQPEDPYQLGGWSMGGIVAFEMATQLVASGKKVSLLALIDSYAPIPEFKDSLLMDEAMLLADWVENLSGLSGNALSVSVEKLRLLKPQEQLNYVLEQAKEVGFLPKEMGQKQSSLLFQVFKANRLSMHFYSPQSYPGQVTLFCASEESHGENLDPTFGWKKLAKGGINMHMIASDHFSIIRTQMLAELLKDYFSAEVSSRLK